MDLVFRSIKSIDKRAVFPIAYLIHSFVQTHRNTGSAEVCENEILFCKAYFFTIGKVSYSPYGLSCVNGVICFDSSCKFNYPQDNLFTYLVNALMRMRPGYMVKIPL